MSEKLGLSVDKTSQLVSSAENQLKNIAEEIKETQKINQNSFDLLSKTIKTIEVFLSESTDRLPSIVEIKSKFEEIKSKYNVINDFISKKAEILSSEENIEENINDRSEDVKVINDVYETVREVLRTTGNDNVFIHKYGNYVDGDDSVSIRKKQLINMINNEKNIPGSAMRQVLENEDDLWEKLEKIA